MWRRQDLLRLVVAEMDLTELPAAVGRLTALTTLDAAHNRLRAVPDELARLEAMELLYLGDNVQIRPPVRDGIADVEVDRRVAGPRPGGVTVSRR